MKTLTLFLTLIVTLNAVVYNTDFHNPYDFPVDVQRRLHNTGAPPPGTTSVTYFTVPAEGEYTDAVDLPDDPGEFTYSVTYSTRDIVGTLVGNSYVLSGESGTWDAIVSRSTGDPATVIEHTLEYDDFTRLPTADASKTLWIVTDEELNADLFREGIDKIVAASGSATGGTGGSGMTKAEFQSTKTDQLAQLGESTVDASIAVTNNAEAEANTAKAAAEASLTQAVPTIPIPAASTEKSILNFTIPGIGVHVNLDPAEDDQLATFCYYVSMLMGWAMILAYTVWVWEYFLQVLGIALTAQQAKGNTVAGTGGQLTAFLAAGIMTIAFLALPAAYWTIAHWDFSALETPSPFDSSGKGTMIGAALYLLSLVFPYSLALTLIALSLVVRKLGATLVLGLHAYVRFVTT